MNTSSERFKARKLLLLSALVLVSFWAVETSCSVKELIMKKNYDLGSDLCVVIPLHVHVDLPELDQSLGRTQFTVHEKYIRL